MFFINLLFFFFYIPSLQDMNPMMGMIGDFHTTSLQPSTSNNTTGDIYGLQITNPQSLNDYQMVDDDDDCDDEEIDDDDDEQTYKDEDDDEEIEFKQEYEVENDNYSNYIINQPYMEIEPKTISTQTHLREGYKKIQPVKRPGLVLKTPIAYQGDIDPSVIPIHRDGMGMFFIFNLFLIFFKFCLCLFLFINLCYPCLLFFIHKKNIFSQFFTFF